jgi:excisionase family DNA binding protein
MTDALDRARHVIEASQRAEWLTVKEFAELRRVHIKTVHRWIRQELIAAERIGRRGNWRIKAA